MPSGPAAPFGGAVLFALMIAVCGCCFSWALLGWEFLGLALAALLQVVCSSPLLLLLPPKILIREHHVGFCRTGPQALRHFVSNRSAWLPDKRQR